MLNTPLAATVLRQLRPHTRVTLPDGSPALVMCQNREHVTVLVDATVRVVNRWDCDAPAAEVSCTVEVTDAALRGLGRAGFRNGLLMHQAVTWAEQQVGRELKVVERLLIADGWASERAEVNRG